MGNRAWPQPAVSDQRDRVLNKSTVSFESGFFSPSDYGIWIGRETGICLPTDGCC